VTTLAQHIHNLHAPAPLTWLQRAYGVWRERHMLARLDSRQLRDIGVTESEAWSEARRPFWDLPH
jgi:uncharacterized protein YjiS (DUF1127 family)